MRVSLSKFNKWNPFENCVWPELDKPITKAEVALAVDKKEYLLMPLNSQWYSDKPPTRSQHIRRIAYLVTHPDIKPIEIDVGAPALNHYVNWIIYDGNHRLAAAFFRGDTEIEVEASGQVDLIKKILA